MTLTKEEKKLRTLYKAYQKENKNKYKEAQKVGKEIKKNILSISKTYDKGKRREVKNRLLTLRKDIIKPPKWTKTELNYKQWKDKRQGFKPSSAVVSKLKKVARIAKATLKGQYGTDKHYGFKNKAERKAMEKDAKKIRNWNDRFAFQGIHTPPEKLSTTMDDMFTYTTYSRWSDDKKRDSLISVMTRIINDTIKRHGALKSHEKIRIAWRYKDNPTDTAKWASTGTYEGNYNSLIPKIKDVTNENGNIYEGIYSTVDVVEVMIGLVPDMGMGAAKSIAVARKTWLEVSDKTECNCGYYAIYRTGNNDYESESKKIKKPAFDLKNNTAGSVQRVVAKAYVDAEVLQVIANYKQYIIKVYNNIFQLKYTIYPVEKLEAKRKRTQKIIEIRIANQHWTALFRYKDIGQTPPTEEEVDMETECAIKEEQKEPELINAKKSLFYPKVIETRIATFDLETTKGNDGRCICYKAGMCVPTMPINSTDDDTCMNQLTLNNKTSIWTLDSGDGTSPPVNPIQELIKEMLKYPSYTFYGHNSGKFDSNFLINQALTMDDIVIKKNNVELNARWLSLSLQHSNKNTITLRDSWCFLQSKLDDATNQFDVPHKKLTDTLNHDDITLNNYNCFGNVIDKYLEHDCLGLLEVLFKFRNVVWTMTLKDIKQKHEDADGDTYTTTHPCGINITECFTLASLAKKGFFRKFYNKFKYPIYNLPKDMDGFIRDSYAGGRVECHYLGEILGKIFYFDFTSLYPAMMVKDLPYGKPETYTDKDKIKKLFDNDKFFGFIKCKVKQNITTFPPLHGVKLNEKQKIVKSGGRLTFPIIEPPETRTTPLPTITLFTEEIKLGIETGQYEYEFIEGVRFCKAPIMKEYVEELYKLKMEASPDGEKPNPVLRQIAKIWVNSAYGYWGLRCFDREGVKIEKVGETSWENKMKNNKLISVGTNGEYNISRFIEDVDIKEVNVGIAAAITSYARIRLWKLTCDIMKKGGDVYYCDTDSIMCNINIKEFPDLMKEYQWDGTGNELGSLKNEAKKNEYYTKLYIGGKKLYALNTRDNKLQKSCKGFSFVEQDDKLYMKQDGKLIPLSYETYKQQKIYGSQFTMICGRNRFVSENDSFNTYFARYNKRITNKVVNEEDYGFVEPISI